MQSIFLPGIRKIEFICGCGHTGTTLLATMMSCHPDLFVPLRETEVFFGGWWTRRRALGRLGRQARRAGKRHIIEKTPKHIRHLDAIRATIRKPKFIFMVRDGRDVTASLAPRFDGDVEAALARWTSDTGICLSQRGRPDVHLIRYEDLVTDPEAILRGLCAFIDVPYTDRLLEYHSEPHLWYGQTEVRQTSGVGKEHNGRRNWQVNQPLFDGRGRWKKDLPAEYLARFRSGEPRRLMEAFGYDPDEA